MENKTKIHSSTQQFTEIVDIVDNVVVLKGGMACSIIEVTASNFALLSRKEQDAKIYSYAALLNSLTFPIQIIVRNKRLDITSYLKLLDDEQSKTQNQLLAEQIKLYRDFVRDLVKMNVVLHKEFYISISFSSLEGGVTGVKQAASTSFTSESQMIATAKRALAAKADVLHSQLRRLAVSSKTLEKPELIKLFYNIYNEGDYELANNDGDVTAPLVKGMQNT
jgi:hypothetical protein